MPNFHVHVYKVVGMVELDVSATDGEKAREKAMNMVNANQAADFAEPDVVLLSKSWKEEEPYRD
jgi:hypothetical protein